MPPVLRENLSRMSVNNAPDVGYGWFVLVFAYGIFVGTVATLSIEEYTSGYEGLDGSGSTRDILGPWQWSYYGLHVLGGAAVAYLVSECTSKVRQKKYELLYVGDNREVRFPTTDPDLAIMMFKAGGWRMEGRPVKSWIKYGPKKAEYLMVYEGDTRPIRVPTDNPDFAWTLFDTGDWDIEIHKRDVSLFTGLRNFIKCPASSISAVLSSSGAR